MTAITGCPGGRGGWGPGSRRVSASCAIDCAGWGDSLLGSGGTGGRGWTGGGRKGWNGGLGRHGGVLGNREGRLSGGMGRCGEGTGGSEPVWILIPMCANRGVVGDSTGDSMAGGDTGDGLMDTERW